MARLVSMLVLVAVGCCPGLPQQAFTGDASRGEQWLRIRGCILCHKVDGEGGEAAPDLGRRIARGYTPSVLAGLLWNHAPYAWARIGRERAGTARFDESQAADLFAYFCSRRYFERPGDAKRGKRTFASRQCAGCHGLSDRVSADASPIVAWRLLGDPIALAQEMWNRPQVMCRAFARGGLRYPRLTSQELSDVLVYLENHPGTRGRKCRFYLASAETGRRLFQAKGCAGCHDRKQLFENRARWRSITDIAAAWWNHALTIPEARTPLSYEEACGLVSYLWSIQDRGDPRRGRRLFATKKCTSCHGDLAAPAERPDAFVARTREAVPASVIAALWRHGPTMQAEMGNKLLPWPRFTGSEMADLGAYLQTRRASLPKYLFP